MSNNETVFYVPARTQKAEAVAYRQEAAIDEEAHGEAAYAPAGR